MAPEPHPQPSSGDRGQAKQESRVVEPIEGEVVMSFLEAKRGLVGVRYTHSYHFGAIQVRNGKVAAFERFCLADADGVVRPAYAKISREAELKSRVPMFRVDALPKAGQVFGSGKTSGRRQMVLLNGKLATLKLKEEEERTTILNELAASFSALQSAHRQALNEKKQVARPQAVSTVRHLSATAAPFSPPKISRALTPQPAVPLVSGWRFDLVIARFAALSFARLVRTFNSVRTIKIPTPMLSAPRPCTKNKYIITVDKNK